MKRAILAIALVLGLAGVAEANGGIFGFRQRVVVRNRFVQPVVAVNAFHSAAFVQPVVRVRAFSAGFYSAPAAFVQPFAVPYGVQQFNGGCNCGGAAAFGVSPFLRLNFGY